MGVELLRPLIYATVLQDQDPKESMRVLRVSKSVERKEVNK